MPKEEWGTKRVCPTTGKRFYDLGRSPIVSPYTGQVVDIDTGNKTRTMIADKADPESKSARDESGETNLDEEDDVDMDLGDDLDDDVLDEDDEDNVSLDEITDVSTDDNNDD
ncbi:TIGR02300 family protein [Mangrovicoccus algicola]|uniref:TIGR02300 family protein n=1 Tax=Mangrovicoccus algicola TaxID=2771008 RepID=A0A8J7CIM8_9RHOB|nr:TIGR02300 family protein [Mangrovicoccus algicola]MBE3639780.1 TIGR02300 family protein [Mangrovicoccus algicola]